MPDNAVAKLVLDTALPVVRRGDRRASGGVRRSGDDLAIGAGAGSDDSAFPVPDRLHVDAGTARPPSRQGGAGAAAVGDQQRWLPGWILLGETDDEIVFGAVGRFWQPVIKWREVSKADFPDFDEPGWGKIAANFTVTPYGRRTLLTYECRTETTDPLSKRQFGRYWWLIRPFVAYIMRVTLRTIKADAEGVQPH